MELLSVNNNSTDIMRRRIRQQPSQLPPNKRICRRQTNTSWSDDLPNDLLEAIMSKLTFFNVRSMKAVCSSWRRAGTTYRNLPFLVLPSLPYESLSVLFYGLGDESFYEYEKVESVFHASLIVGSSNGFLILLDDKADPYLLNFFTRRLIKLPDKENFPHINSVYHNEEQDIVRVEFNNRTSTMSFDVFRKYELINKAILSNDGECVIVIYGNFSGLAYCRQSGALWYNLDYLNREFGDILCSDNKLYALGSDSSIHMWDFSSGLPEKKIDITPGSHLPHFSTQCYLAESHGDILYVHRNIKPIYAEKHLQTLDFKVYKIDFKIKELSRMKSLGDRALFLGGNHAVSLCADEQNGFERNSIYFTNHHSQSKAKYLYYKGLNMGVYNMKNRSVTKFLQVAEKKPWWIFP